MFVMLIFAVVLRFGNFIRILSGFVLVRYVYDINLLMFYLRLLQLYYIHPRLGPKVIVIWRMVCVTINEE